MALRAFPATSTNMPTTASSTLSQSNTRLRFIAGLVILAAVYVVAGRIGFTASAIHPVVSSAWPPSGIALAALLVFGIRFWPGITLGAFLVNVTGGIAPVAAAGISVGNTLEAVVAAWILTSFGGFKVPLQRRRDVFGLVLAAVAAAPVSATIGVSVLTLFGADPGLPFGAAWLAWASGDAIGMFLITPLLLTWWSAPALTPSGRDVVEGSVIAASLVAFSLVLFEAPVSFVYTIFPVGIWAALRFGPRGAATATFVVAVIAVSYTVRGVGPFTTSTDVNDLFRLQSFLGVLAITSLIVSAVMAERRTAEAALDASRQQHRDIVHYASVGVYQTDPSGKILLANPALAEILGYDRPEELIGRNVTDQVYLEPAQRPALISKYESFGTREFDLEVQWKRRDGTPVWVDLHARSVRTPAGDTAYFEGFVYDLTGRKRLEDQFRQAQKMEAIGRLAGGVAHDFNNLLTVIRSCTDFILDDPALPGEHRADLTEVRNATDRATSLTRQLLAFGRTQVLRPSTISLNERLVELSPMLKRLFEATIEIDLQPGAHLWNVRADPGQIEQVLLNLAINARDAMPNGGTLTFTTENFVVGADRSAADQEYVLAPGDYVLLRVRDTGGGMDEETQRRIFEPFFTTKEIGKGTGLGLSTVYGIVKQSGGYIRVSSTPGNGSEFLIYLPRTRATPDKIVPRPHRQNGHATGTVLVAEDEPAVRDALERILTAVGYTVLQASDGAEALELFTALKGKVDLLITDIVMPVMDGRELARRCVAQQKTLKVIFLSGYTQESLLSQQTFEDGTEFIEKPFVRDAILERVATVLRA
jgi:PAS domain S-box-containing protein